MGSAPAACIHRERHPFRRLGFWVATPPPGLHPLASILVPCSPHGWHLLMDSSAIEIGPRIHLPHLRLRSARQCGGVPGVRGWSARLVLPSPLRKYILPNKKGRPLPGGLSLDVQFVAASGGPAA